MHFLTGKERESPARGSLRLSCFELSDVPKVPRCSACWGRGITGYLAGPDLIKIRQAIWELYVSRGGYPSRFNAGGFPILKPFLCVVHPFYVLPLLLDTGLDHLFPLKHCFR